jgi:hypothetical protein
LDPEVWYDMEMEDFTLMMKGYWKKETYHERIFRNVAWITHASFVSKAIPMNRLWPIGEQDKPLSKAELDKRSEEIMKRVELTNKILEEKAKHGGTVKNRN